MNNVNVSSFVWEEAKKNDEVKQCEVLWENLGELSNSFMMQCLDLKQTSVV